MKKYPSYVLDVPCPLRTCGAQPGEPCRTINGAPKSRPHYDRKQAAMKKIAEEKRNETMAKKTAKKSTKKTTKKTAKKTAKKAAKRGRPLDNPRKGARTAAVLVRFTPTELGQLQAAAERAGVSVPALLRRKAGMQ